MSLIVEIRKSFGNFNLDVAFTAQSGITGLLGTSGSGKSVTLKCIAGLETPDEGFIALDGQILFDSKKIINLPPQQRRIGYLFQQYALFPHMTVTQNIASGVRQRKFCAEETARLLAAFQLEDCANQYPRQLSGGQQQRVALARILASQPNALLLDEPFSALDDYLKWQMEFELSERLAEYSGPVMFVTHNQEEIRHACQSVCVLHGGKSQPVQTVEDWLTAPVTVSSCRLSGCQNLSRTRLLPDGQVAYIDWGCTFSIPIPLKPSCTHVGVFSHQIKLFTQPATNRIPCRILRVIRGTLSGSKILLLSTPGGERAHNLLRVETVTHFAESAQLWAEILPESLIQLSEG